MTVSSFKTGFDGVSFLAGNTAYDPIAGNRGVFGGGISGYTTNIDYINIASTGNSTTFGSLTVGRSELTGCASSVRGLFMGGLTYSGGYIYYNVIDYVTIASVGNATDFGDLTSVKVSGAACSSSTRGLHGGGYTTTASTSNIDIIDYITIATTGNAIDFGDLTVARCFLGSCSSSTRGLWMGGETTSRSNVIDYVTIASTGNATDFGDLSAIRTRTQAFSSSTRGVNTGGNESSGYVNTMEYVTIASTGNTTDFGDLTVARGSATAFSSISRGVTVGGLSGAGTLDVIDYVTIATTGNAIDFGDLATARYELGGFSNGHGGLAA